MKRDRLLTKFYSAVWIILAAAGYVVGMMKKFGALDDNVSWLLSDAVFSLLVVLVFAFVLSPLLFVIHRYAKSAGMIRYCKVLGIASVFFVVWSVMAAIILSVMHLMNVPL